MPRHAFAMSRTVVAAVACAVLALGVPSVAAQQRRMEGPPKEAGTVEASLSDVPQVVMLPGRAVAYETAAVRPRVGGLIEAITYQPGQLVEAGTPMFRLESETLEAALASAKAAEAGAEQARQSAAATVERYRALVGKGVSRVDLESSQVALSQAEAALALARTNRQTAALELERAVIVAPITGEAGQADVTIGSLVTANQSDPLTTITRVDPIYVDVAASSTRVLQARQRIRSGEMTAMDAPRITLTLEDGTTYEAPGEIVSTASTVSTTTGTVGMRLRFPNPDRLILPGQFLRVSMTLGTVSAVLVPQRATTRLADGSLAAFVVADGRAHRATLTESGVWNNAWAVTEGIKAGDAVIVDGLANLRDGAAVTAVPVTLDENGVVVPQEASDGSTGQGGARTPPAEPTAQGGGATQAAGAAQAPASGPNWIERLKSVLGFGSAAEDSSSAASPTALPEGDRDMPAKAAFGSGLGTPTAVAG